MIDGSERQIIPLATPSAPCSGRIVSQFISDHSPGITIFNGLNRYVPAVCLYKANIVPAISIESASPPSLRINRIPDIGLARLRINSSKEDVCRRSACRGDDSFWDRGRHCLHQYLDDPITHIREAGSR